MIGRQVQVGTFALIAVGLSIAYAKEQQALDVLESGQETLAWNRLRTHVSLTKRYEDLAVIDDVEYIPEMR